MKKIVLLLLIISTGIVHAQQKNWQHLDLQKDSVFGISSERAYNELLKGKTPQPVIVAVIDAGIDTGHEDLRPVLWQGRGWSFIGSAKGNVHYDNLELTRQVRQQQARFDGPDSNLNRVRQLSAYQQYAGEKAALGQQISLDEHLLRNVALFGRLLDTLTGRTGKADPSPADIQALQTHNAAEAKVKAILLANLKPGMHIADFRQQEIDGATRHYQEELGYHLNVHFDPRDIVGDDYFNSAQSNYGSADIQGPDPTHGTHVAGIIGAVRHNGLGMDGIADDVQLMTLRAVPDGDERDKDIANAIRYAASHGAKVINMSFGKAYSQDKKAVDEAVQYALSKDVLLVQAAGNSDENLDSVMSFPNRRYAAGGEAGAWIVVGASGWRDDAGLKAPFSNYGKTSVDVFAPGEQIWSCVPGSKYAAFDGTSMACPVVSGLAALIREYYPRLSAAQVKDIILRSVVKVDHPILLNGKAVPFSELCRTGGIVNAYNALLLAAQLN